MKDIIKQQLDKLHADILHATPQYRAEKKYISIWDVNPLKLKSFMEANNIPNDATFDIIFDEGECEEVPCLIWDVLSSTTDSDKQAFIVKKFNANAFQRVARELRCNRYKRQSVGTNKLKQFGFSSNELYSSYMAKDFDILERYFSLYYKR